jgi:hypothetical protein
MAACSLLLRGQSFLPLTEKLVTDRATRMPVRMPASRDSTDPVGQRFCGMWAGQAIALGPGKAGAQR